MKQLRPPHGLPAVLGFLAVWGLLVPTKAGAGEETPPPPRVGRVQRLPDAVTLATLSNGLTVILQENHVAPVATVRCYVRNTGSAFEGPYLGAGLSHVLEHVVSGGTTTHRTEKEIEAIIDSFGGATNAYTTRYVTAYYVNCPAENVMTAVELVADAMQHVVFETEAFERELRVVRRELADGEVDRRRVRWKLLNLTLYTTHPVRHPTIGYLDVLERTGREAIVDFYRQRYVPNNQIFVVVGDFETDAVLKHVARQWAGTPRGAETTVPLPSEPEQIAPREVFQEMEGNTCDLVVAWPTVPLAHPDLFALDVAAYILAEGESSRLAQKLKYDRRLALSVSSASYTPHFVRGFFGVMASCTPETWEEACDEILREVYRLRDERVTPAELAKAKKQKAAELVFSQQTVEQAAENLGRDFLATGDPLFSKRYVEGIRGVTAEQIQDAARRYFVPRRLNRVVIVPPGTRRAEGAESAGEPEGEIRLVRLANGLRVLLKRHAHLPLVNLQAYVLGGSLADTPETAGRAALVARMLDQGTATRSARQIAAYFDSIGARLSMTAGRNTVYGSLTTLKEDFPQAAALFAECFTAPTFPPEAFARVKALALGAIARRQDDPHQEILELFYDALPSHSPYHIVPGGKRETVEALTADDLAAYHARYFVPQNMLVTVFGDVEPEEAIARVRKGFGHLEPAEHFQPVSWERDNRLQENIRRHKNSVKSTGMVLLAYPGPGVRDRQEHAAMIVLDALTSGYSYPGGWLHAELRGAGLVYFVHAFQITGPVPGYLAVLSQTRPDKVGEVVQRIQRNLARVGEGRFGDEEFERAQQMVIALHAQENTTVAGQAQQAALDELYGLGYDYDQTFDDRIRAVTRDDVVRVARKYFTHHVLVTTSPEDRPTPRGNDRGGRIPPAVPVRYDDLQMSWSPRELPARRKAR